jgi:hypothetical protein
MATVTYVPALVINAPEWFSRSDFQAWLNNPANNLATWHQQGQLPNEQSDTFITYDNGEGSDFGVDFPEDIHTKICRICQDHGVLYGRLHLTNLS